jgi:hypothetical protein
MNGKKEFEQLLSESGFTQTAIEELWKWYDSSKKKGVASY